MPVIARAVTSNRLGTTEQALAIYLEVGDHAGEARELHAVSASSTCGRAVTEQAAGHLRRSLALFRDAGFRSGEAYVLGNLGELELRQGRYAAGRRPSPAVPAAGPRDR